MNNEKQKQIKDLIKIYRPNESLEWQNGFLLGVCEVLMTDEQADKMISYLQKWIGEK